MGEKGEDAMRVSLLVLLLAVSSIAFAEFSVSDSIIECCGQWNATVTVLASGGTPIMNCPVKTSVMRGSGEQATSVSDITYFTNSKGTAKLSFKPSSPDEKYRISVNCGGVKGEQIIPVVGGEEINVVFPTLPSINLDFGETDWVGIGMMVVGGLLVIGVGAILFFRGWRILHIVENLAGRGGGKRKSMASEKGVEKEMEPKRFILEHERRIFEAGRLTRKHKRKVVRLGHEYVRRFS